MQARRGRTARVPGHQPRDDLPARNRLPGPHGRHQRLIGGPDQRGVADADDLPPADRSGEAHHPVGGGAHDRPGRRRQVDAPVTGRPVRRRPLETAHHPDRRVERPGEAGGRGRKRHGRPPGIGQSGFGRWRTPGQQNQDRREQYDRDGSGQEARWVHYGRHTSTIGQAG
ncbi:hypothetical protein Pen01_26420 [Phytomonospora endophytica]|nr:hypothetical protein Pen01_26420 [Phytomonospora endophytica]